MVCVWPAVDGECKASIHDVSSIPSSELENKHGGCVLAMTSVPSSYCQSQKDHLDCVAC